MGLSAANRAIVAIMINNALMGLAMGFVVFIAMSRSRI